MAGLKLPGKKGITVNKKVLSFLKPKCVYIPLYDTNDILVKEGDNVYKGQVIAYRSGTFKLPIFSSVSGKVKSFEEVNTTRGVSKSIVIENDGLEKIKKRT